MAILSPLSILHFLVCCGSLEFISFVQSASFNKRTGPPRHTDFFHKLPSSKNKTIPYSERPGKELIVFDVDGTLWPYEIDTDPLFQDPFSIKSFDNGTAFVGGHPVYTFPGVEDVLLELIEKGYVLAAASLTNSTSKTMALLNAFDLIKHFKYLEIRPGQEKISLVTEICSRSDILLENVLYFERDPGSVLDMLWRNVIIYCVDKNGITKDCVRKGLYVFGIRPRQDRIHHGPRPTPERIEKSNKNKSRPAYEKDGTEIEGFDYNATKIEYEYTNDRIKIKEKSCRHESQNELTWSKNHRHIIDKVQPLQEKSGMASESVVFLLQKYTSRDIHALLDLNITVLPIGLAHISVELLSNALFLHSTRKCGADISDDDLPSTTESRAKKKLRLKEEKLKRRELKKATLKESI